eukprot:189012-Chlamydomonas_euryale.AAC.2
MAWMAVACAWKVWTAVACAWEVPCPGQCAERLRLCTSTCRTDGDQPGLHGLMATVHTAGWIACFQSHAHPNLMKH